MKKLSHSFAKVSHSYKIGVALVGMRHLNYKIYSKNNKIYPPHF